MDQNNRRNNIIIYRLTEKHDTAYTSQGISKNEQGSVLDLIKTVTGKDTPEAITKCTRLGKASQDRSRPLLVMFRDTATKDNFMDNLKQLKGSKYQNVSIAHDMTKTQREELVKKVAEAKAKEEQELGDWEYRVVGHPSRWQIKRRKKEGGNWQQPEHNCHTGGKSGISDGGHRKALTEEITATATRVNNIVNIVNTTNNFNVPVRNNARDLTLNAKTSINDHKKQTICWYTNAGTLTNKLPELTSRINNAINHSNCRNQTQKLSLPTDNSGTEARWLWHLHQKPHRTQRVGHNNTHSKRVESVGNISANSIRWAPLYLCQTGERRKARNNMHLQKPFLSNRQQQRPMQNNQGNRQQTGAFENHTRWFQLPLHNLEQPTLWNNGQ